MQSKPSLPSIFSYRVTLSWNTYFWITFKSVVGSRPTAADISSHKEVFFFSSMFFLLLLLLLEGVLPVCYPPAWNADKELWGFSLIPELWSIHILIGSVIWKVSVQKSSIRVNLYLYFSIKCNYMRFINNKKWKSIIKRRKKNQTILFSHNLNSYWFNC